MDKGDIIYFLILLAGLIISYLGKGKKKKAASPSPTAMPEKRETVEKDIDVLLEEWLGGGKSQKHEPLPEPTPQPSPVAAPPRSNKMPPVSRREYQPSHDAIENAYDSLESGSESSKLKKETEQPLSTMLSVQDERDSEPILDLRKAVIYAAILERPYQ